MLKKLFYLLIPIMLITCKPANKDANAQLQVVTTTTMITDLVQTIGGTHITVQGLMGAGVDPHLYKASEGDVQKLVNADAIFYNGLHLEGKLVAIFEKMGSQRTKAIALGEALDTNTLIGSDYFASNYDPHIWFSIEHWKKVTLYTIKKLKELAPKYAKEFEANGKKYLEALQQLQTQTVTTISTLPKEKRILVTAHDAFSYFGQAYDFQVVGLQGLSTATEAGVQDVQRLANFIIEKQVKAIFVETSVPQRTIEALQAAVAAKEHQVVIGGALYSDALGNPNTPEGTYIGMFTHNVTTIVNALK